MFTVKEVATFLKTSTQNIYKQEDDLVKLGYVQIEYSETGKKKSILISQEGFNYLKDRQIERIKRQKTNEFIQTLQTENEPTDEQVANKEENSCNQQEAVKVDTVSNTLNNDLLQTLLSNYQQQVATLNNHIATLSNQLKETEQQRDYFKAKFEEKDTFCNEYIYSHMLPSAEADKPKTFWQKIFNK